MKTVDILLSRIEKLAVENAELRRNFGLARRDLSLANSAVDASEEDARDLAQQVRSLEEQLGDIKWELTGAREDLRVEKSFHASCRQELDTLKVELLEIKGVHLNPAEVNLVMAGNWIEACKQLRTRTGCDLATAKRIVDSYRK